MGPRRKDDGMRPRTLLALLLVVPLVDALFLIVVATRLGWAITVALVVLTAVLGMLLLRAEGARRSHGSSEAGSRRAPDR